MQSRLHFGLHNLNQGSTTLEVAFPSHRTRENRMASIFESRAGRSPFQRPSSAAASNATEYGGTDDGSNPLSSGRRPMSAAERRREIVRQRDDRAPSSETVAERNRRAQVGGFGNRRAR
jgi:hypothetical protein